MRYLIGLSCFAIAAGFVTAGLAHRRRVAAARALGPARPEEPGRLEGLGEIARPLILGALAYVGLKTTLVFFAFGAAEVLSVLDLAGFLSLLAAYGFWLTMRTKHRLPVADAAQEGASDGAVLRPDRAVPRLRRRAGAGALRAGVGAPLDQPRPRSATGG